MLDDADVTNVDDRDSLVQLVLIGLSVFSPLARGGGGGGEDNLFPEGNFGVFIRFTIWKMSDGANAMVRLYILWL